MYRMSQFPRSVGPLLAVTVIALAVHIVTGVITAEERLHPPKKDSSRRPDRKPIDVGSRKQLFLDELFFASQRGVELTVNRPANAGLVVKADRPWERGGIDPYLTVVPDPEAGHFKLYYSPYVKLPGGSELDRRYMVCCAISADGIHWEKPNLGVVEFAGNKENNIVMMATRWDRIITPSPQPVSSEPTFRELGNVVIDAQDVPERRYKMLYRARPHGLYGAYSADGFRWTVGNDGKTIAPGADSQNVCFWDDSLGRWTGYFRYWNSTRRVTRIETDNFWSWPSIHKEDIVLAPDPLDVYIHRLDGPDARAGEFVEKRMKGRRFDPDKPDIFLWQTDVASDLDGVDFYNQPVIKYPYAERSYVMPFSAFYHPPDLMEIQLAVSRDGIHWQRPGDRQPWLRMPLDDEGIRRMYAAPAVVRDGNWLYHYHTEIPSYHSLAKPGSYKMDDIPDYAGTVRRTALRLDGYMSVDAGNQESGFVTPPLVHRGKRLQLNVDTSASGYVRVELLNIYGNFPLGYQIKGYTLDECERIIANSTHRTVSWGDKSDVSELAGKPIRMHVRLRNAKLYSFQFIE